MIYSLLVLSSPVSGHGSRHAVEFARAVLERGHTLHRVFFLDAGTLAGSANHVLPQDERDPGAEWTSLARESGVELVICVTSALRHGMLDTQEAARHERAGASIADAFTIAGLGDLVLTFDCLPVADRGGAILQVLHSSDLGATDAWTGAVVPDVGGGPRTSILRSGRSLLI